MPVTSKDAAEALELVKEAEQRSLVARSYQSAAPHLMLWGCVYAAAYGFGYFRPGAASLVWAILIPIAVFGDFLIARHDRGRISWSQFLGVSVALFAFTSAAIVVMQPQHGNQIGAFVPLIVALAYILLGIRARPRLMLTGVALGALTLIGFFALPSIFMLWMAISGGSALVLGGVWLRQA
jgi:hypothetical protein